MRLAKKVAWASGPIAAMKTFRDESSAKRNSNMIRWIRNIFIALTVAIFVIEILYEIALGQDFSELPIVLLLVSIALAIFLWLLWALGLTRFNHAWIRQRSIVVLSYVEQAVRLNLPLPQLLRAAQASEPRWIADTIGELRQQLDQGSSITDALRNSVPGTGHRTLALVGAAERVGRLGPELSRVVRQREHPSDRNLADRSFLRSYPVAMTITIVCILFLIMVFVIPKFEQIFHDFRVELPPLTRAVVSLTTFPSVMTWLVIAITGSVLAITAQQLRRRMDLLAPVRWFASNRDLADICHVIAGGLTAGQPLNSAIRGASDLVIGRPLRRKLHRWAEGIEQGLPDRDAASDAGMPELIAGMMTTTEGFTFLSRYYAWKFSRLKIFLRAAAVPAMVFFFGIIVAIVALSLFLPLIALINSVSSPGGPNSSWL
jgi:type IV pilus assembly protein PilC